MSKASSVDQFALHFAQGQTHFKKQEFKKAKDEFEQCLKIQRNDLQSQLYLALSLAELSYISESEILLKNMIQQNSSYAPAYYYLGLIQKNIDQSSARKNLEEEFHLSGFQAQGLFDLAELYCLENAFEQAIHLLKAIMVEKPDAYKAIYQLALIYFSRGQYQDAYDLFVKYEVRKGSLDVREKYNFSLVLQGLRKISQAIELLKDCLLCSPEYKNAKRLLAILLSESGLSEEALSFFAKEDAFKSDSQYYSAWIRCLLRHSEYEKAKLLAEAYLIDCPKDPYISIIAALALPRAYQSQDELEKIRQSYIVNLNSLVEKNSDNYFNKKILLDALDHHVNFLLTYQGENDLVLQKQYGDLHSSLVDECDQKYIRTKKFKRKKSHRIRIAYLSTFFFKHSISKTTLGFVQFHDPQKVETFVYHLGDMDDDWTLKWQEYSEHFKNLEFKIDQIAQHIEEDQIDILFMPDIGMDPRTMALAARRLAPIQMTTQGHPETSGYPNMDYFISSAFMEREDAQKFYSEKLILLPDLAFAYPKPELSSDKTREKFNLPEDQFIYISSQSLIKYLPKELEIYLEIIKQTEDAMLLFISSSDANENAIFRQNIHKLCESKKIDINKIILLPRMSEADFHAIHQVCDVFLDAIAWSANNSLLQAWWHSDLPAVILPKMLMRSRHTLAHLKMLELEECIAQDEEGYIRIALALKNDKEFYSSCRKKIAENKYRLYENDDCIRSFEKELPIMIIENQHRFIYDSD